MSWEKDPLWAKARLYFQRAFSESREEPTFGLWCSLGLELLARAALSSISPTLLAEPDREHKYLLHALGRGSERNPKKSLAASQVMSLCLDLFPEFTKDDLKVSLALVNRRNEELHSGSAAFEAYPHGQWIAGFYKVCQSFATILGESLESLFGDEEATIATEILAVDRNDTKQRVQSRIASHRSVFNSKPEEVRETAKAETEEQGNKLAYEAHHRVTCPACECTGTVKGKAFGKERITDEDGDIVVRQDVSPTSFSCSGCELAFEGYAELEEAGLGGYHTRRTTYSPDEYYGLIHPDDLPQHVEEYLMDGMPEYDNE